MNNRQLKDFMRGFEKQAGVGSMLGGALRSTTQAFKGMGKKIKNTGRAIKDTGEEWGDFSKNVSTSMGDDMKSLRGAVKGTSSKASTGIRNGISNGISKAKAGLKNEVLDFRAKASGKSREVFDRQLAARGVKRNADSPHNTLIRRKVRDAKVVNDARSGSFSPAPERNGVLVNRTKKPGPTTTGPSMAKGPVNATVIPAQEGTESLVKRMKKVREAKEPIDATFSSVQTPKTPAGTTNQGTQTTALATTAQPQPESFFQRNKGKIIAGGAAAAAGVGAGMYLNSGGSDNADQPQHG